MIDCIIRENVHNRNLILVYPIRLVEVINLWLNLYWVKRIHKHVEMLNVLYDAARLKKTEHKDEHIYKYIYRERDLQK